MDIILKKILSDILDVDESEIYEGFGPDDAPLWDSMNNLRLITAIEDEFQIKLSMDEIQLMSDYQKIKKIIRSHISD